jgi:hemerythrin
MAPAPSSTALPLASHPAAGAPSALLLRIGPMPLTFPEDLIIGINEVDEQHRAFYAALAQLHDAMRSGQLEEVTRIVTFVEGYAATHFAAEEKLMTELTYPELEEHAARHAEFVLDFREWRRRFAVKGPTPALVVELSAWLTGWLRDHIRKVDGQMARFVRSRSAAK